MGCALAGGVFMMASLVAGAQEADFPGAQDLRNVARPANSQIVGAMHIDNDEYSVPVGPAGQRKLGKTVVVTGPVDVLAYAGPTTASSLTTYTGLSSQLKQQGYSEVFTCVRATCGDTYGLIGILAQPLIDTMHEGTWGGQIIDATFTSNSDARYGAFKKGEEYVLALGVLSPGHKSGAMLIRLNGPADQTVLAPAETKAAETSAAQPAQQSKSASNQAGRDAVKAAARSMWSSIPH